MVADNDCRCLRDSSDQTVMNSTRILSTTTLYPTTPAWYHSSASSLVPGISDEHLAAIAPIPVYWLYSALFHIIDTLDLLPKYRIHESEEMTSKNRASQMDVLKAVIVQQAMQVALALWWISAPTESINSQQAMQRIAQWSGTGPSATWWLYWWGIPTFQLLVAM